MDDRDLRYLRRCVDLAAEAVDAGDQPFGSILVSAEGDILFEDRNRTGGGDATRHPEFAIVR
jgi:tRNA(Arg) A34 adenosine deaminase TadA